jgi:hypothetical protein
MRFTWRVTALILLLVILVVPLTAYASGGKCPDDPVASKDCNPDTPPYYVVINRDFDALDREGSGCQPFILKHPECKDCCTENDATEDCMDAYLDVQERVCPLVADRTDWSMVDGESVVLYVMCCDCNANADGAWRFSIVNVYRDGGCEFDEENHCILGLPPGTGIDLPAPVIIGGLALLGVALVGTGVMVRRRSPKLA